jgi:hypothetical protein
MCRPLLPDLAQFFIAFASTSVEGGNDASGLEHWTAVIVEVAKKVSHGRSANEVLELPLYIAGQGHRVGRSWGRRRVVMTIQWALCVFGHALRLARIADNARMTH